MVSLKIYKCETCNTLTESGLRNEILKTGVKLPDILCSYICTIVSSHFDDTVVGTE